MGTRAIWETLYLSKVILLGHMVTGCNKEDRQPREALGWSWNNLQGGQSQLVQIQPRLGSRCPAVVWLGSRMQE